MIHVDLKCIDNFLFFAVLILKREYGFKNAHNEDSCSKPFAEI